MEILLKIDWNVLNTYIDNKKIIANKHPDYDIWILNYSKETAFERAWDTYTISCRGLVVDSDGNILARPYKKFFNYEEVCNSDDFQLNPISDYEIYSKEDGSLGILFNYMGDWLMATRGSFTSNQAIKGFEILKKYYISDLDITNTYLFEIIYPENLIVKNYFGEECLILLGIIKNTSGYLFTYEEVVGHVLETKSNFRIVKKHDISSDISTLKNNEIPNEEGYVLRLKNTDFLMKLKFNTYIKLHGIMTNLSSKDIWRCLRDDIGFNDIIDVIPDEHYLWVRKQEKIIIENYVNIEKDNIEIFNEIMNRFIKKGMNPTKKDFALANLVIKEGNASIRFRMFQNRKYDDIIWKLVEPNFEKMHIYEGDE